MADSAQAHSTTPTVAAPANETRLGAVGPAKAADGAGGQEVHVMPGSRGRFVLSRLLSLALLGLFGYVAFVCIEAGYALATDAHIAPFILSPDSEAVISSHVTLSGLQNERATIQARIVAAEHALAATRESMASLHELNDKLAGALEFSGQLATQSESALKADREQLATQQALLVEALQSQADVVSELRKRLEAGVAHQADLEREEAELRRLRLLQLQNEREQLSVSTRQREVAMTRQALRGAHSEAQALAPEVLQQQVQLLRLKHELAGLQAQERGKVAELAALHEQAARLQQLVDQIESRPLYRALRGQQLVAFVPYSQLAEVQPGYDVYECRTLGIFGCQAVGTIAEVVPGEVSRQRADGDAARGQYVVMKLSQPSVAWARALRVRAPSDEER